MDTFFQLISRDKNLPNHLRGKELEFESSVSGIVTGEQKGIRESYISHKGENGSLHQLIHRPQKGALLSLPFLFLSIIELQESPVNKAKVAQLN